jgi:molybdopterin molybdotransferase
MHKPGPPSRRRPARVPCERMARNGHFAKIGGLASHLIVHDPVLTELQPPQRIASLTPLDDVLARINALVKPVAAQRIDDLTTALGRTAAEDIIIDAMVPPAALALRDGWALSSHLTIDAGPYAPVSIPIAIRVDVGERLPPNADGVAPLDALISRDGEAHVLSPVTPGEGSLPAGGDVPRGVTLIRAGERLDALRIALLAALGVTHAQVRVPRLSLTRPHSRPDRVLDAVMACIADAIGRAGAIATTRSPYDVLEHASTQTDVDAFVVVGGTGCGRLDNAVQTLASIGNVQVHGVGLIPAETSAFGTVGPHPVLLLPGRFDAALAGWHMLGRAMLMRLTEMRSRRAFAPQSSRAKFLRPQDLPSLSRCGAKVRLPHRWPPATCPSLRSVGQTDGSSSHPKAKAGRSIAKWRSDPGHECRLENSED